MLKNTSISRITKCYSRRKGKAMLLTLSTQKKFLVTNLVIKEIPLITIVLATLIFWILSWPKWIRTRIITILWQMSNSPVSSRMIITLISLYFLTLISFGKRLLRIRQAFRVTKFSLTKECPRIYISWPIPMMIPMAIKYSTKWDKPLNNNQITTRYSNKSSVCLHH